MVSSRRDFSLLAVAFLTLGFSPQPLLAENGNHPIQVLLVAGGCCHDYTTQTKLLKEGIESRIDASVTVVLSPNKSTGTTFEIYESDDWAKGFDVIVHDECSANVTDRPYVDRILAAHRAGTPAVNLHCAMHSYRWGNFREPVEIGSDNAGWYEMIGVQSSGHGPKAPLQLIGADSTHPIVQGFAGWKTIDEELYNNVRVHSGTSVLVSATQMMPPTGSNLRKILTRNRPKHRRRSHGPTFTGPTRRASSVRR